MVECFPYLCWLADAHLAGNTKIKLDWKTGVAATNWDAIAKKENLDAMATELRKLEDTVKEIHAEMLHLRKREEDMRDLNGVQSAAVMMFSISDQPFWLTLILKSSFLAIYMSTLMQWPPVILNQNYIELYLDSFF